MGQFATYEKKDRVAVITVNRPEVMNALHPPAHWEMTEMWDDFAMDPNLRVAILTGTGERAFSAGNDLKYSAAHGPDQIRPDTGFGGLTTRFDLWKPVIAAVNGFALGGGLEMAVACDIIVAADHVEVGLPEPLRGLMASAGGVHRLPRMIPQKVAMGMMLTARRISVQEAERWGLVNEVVPLPDLMPAALRWAEEIGKCSPASIRATKQASMQGMHLTVQDAIRGQTEEQYDQVEVWRASPDRLEGPRAFTERRQPNWET